MDQTTAATAELAALFGVITRSITDLAQRDIVVRAGHGYALTESVREYCKHLRNIAKGWDGEANVVSATAHHGRRCPPRFGPRRRR